MEMTKDTPTTYTGTIWCCFTSTSIQKPDGVAVRGECVKKDFFIKRNYMVLPFHVVVVGAVVKWLAPGTSDLKVGFGFGLDKKLHPTLSLSTQVYKMGSGDILLGLTLRWTSIPSRGE